MRISKVLSTLALLLIPVIASAQQTPTPDASKKTKGWVDFGVRGTTTTGDASRYERYRDLGDGLFLEGFKIEGQKSDWRLDVGGDHIGRKDQRFTGHFVLPGKVKGWAQWDQMPMLMSRTTQTLYSGVGTDVLTIDDTIQAQVQASSSSLLTLFPANAKVFDTKSRRWIGEGGVQYIVNPDLTLNQHISLTTRSGEILYGGSFGHGSFSETVAPVDQRLTDLDGGAEFQRGDLLVRGGYTASLFHNNYTTLTFDNPFRAVDSSTPSRGSGSLPPSSSYYTVNGLLSYRLPHRTRATAFVSVGSLKDAGDPIMPQTLNSTVTTAPLDRNTVEGSARTTATNFSFISRPSDYYNIDVRFRSYDYDNRTPLFAMTQRVAYDNSASTVSPAADTEPFGVKRYTFDANLNLTPAPRMSAGVGFTALKEERTYRFLSSTVDKVTSLWFDTVGNQYVTLRTKYEHAQKRGAGLEEGELELTGIGEQSGLRQFDLADRNRNRLTVIGNFTPTAILGLNASVAAGKDDYADSGADIFGLADNTNRVVSAGFDVVPNDRVSFGASYSFERYAALQRSRNSSSAALQTNPAYNWALDNTERVHSFVLNGSVLKIAEKVDLTVGYDVSKSTGVYNFILGEFAPTVLSTPTALPDTLSQLSRGTLDLVYNVNTKLGLGLSYWYEQYKVKDFTLDESARPDPNNPITTYVRGNVLMLGYLYQPYTANTVWGRVFYRW
jgi:MtrB/PioB family decaheme-associated outer membrane protein